MPRRGIENRPLEAQELPPEMPREYLARAVEEIDASMFSGDCFWDPDARANLRWHMARWERGLKGIEEMASEDIDENESMLDRMLKNSRKI